MKTFARPTWEDIVFASRNQDYGAYTIRKSYDENVTRAALISLLTAALFFGALQVATLFQHPIKRLVPPPFEGGLTIVPRILVDPPPATQPTAPHVVNKDLPVKVVVHDLVELPKLPIETTPVANPTASLGTGPIGEPIVTTVVDVAPVVAAPPVDFAEFMPEFEGGVSAMMKFLKKNLHYPAGARRMGEEGTVFVRFVVSDDGAVSNVEVLRGVSGQLDAEASRVIAGMPRWKPGRQHGRTVNVRMVLPVKFQLER